MGSQLMRLDRDASIQAIRDRTSPWDIVIIGGGANLRFISAIERCYFCLTHNILSVSYTHHRAPEPDSYLI